MSARLHQTGHKRGECETSPCRHDSGECETSLRRHDRGEFETSPRRHDSGECEAIGVRRKNIDFNYITTKSEDY